jgi:uncharacterized membrane protein
MENKPNENSEQDEPNQLEKEVLLRHGEKVIYLVNDVAKANIVSVEESCRSLIRTIDEEKMCLVDPKPPKVFVTFVFSIYNVWFWVVLGSVALMAASIYFIPPVYPFVSIRYCVSGVFLLFLPGYVLMESFYPQVKTLDIIERFALNIGMSLVLVPLIGLLLNYSFLGITVDNIFTSLSLLIIILSIIGVWRNFRNFKTK